MILSCATPAYPSCNSSFAWEARESTRSRGLSTGQESCSSPEPQPRYFSDLSRWELGFASSRAHRLQRCRTAVRRLCRELGYFGIFEVEFLWFDGRWAAIDFNPRLFNQIGMDIRRGMPLPLLGLP